MFICGTTLQAGWRQLTASKCPCKCAKRKEFQCKKRYLLSSYCSLHSGTKNAEVHYHGNATIYRAAQVNRVNVSPPGEWLLLVPCGEYVFILLSLLTFSVKIIFFIVYNVTKKMTRILDKCTVLRESQDIFQKVSAKKQRCNQKVKCMQLYTFNCT